jgi:hypothetical protein
LNFDYDFPDDWDEYSQDEKQQFFNEGRARWMWFMFKSAQHEQERAERVSSFRVDDTLT